MKKEFVTDIVSLDMLLAIVCDTLNVASKDSKSNFLKIHDHKIMSQIKAYAEYIKEKNFSDMNDGETEQFFEEGGAHILDAVSEANFDFFKNGFKLGAKILTEILC